MAVSNMVTVDISFINAFSGLVSISKVGPHIILSNNFPICGIFLCEDPEI